MLKKHHMKFLAVVMVVCYLITYGPFSLIAQASGLSDATLGGVFEEQTEESTLLGEGAGNQTGEPEEQPQPPKVEPEEEPDNPDGLEGPEEVSAPELYMSSRGLSVMGGLMGESSSPPVDDHGNIEEGYPGYLALDKKAEQVSPNRWRVTLTLTGTNLQTTSDIVLVIDRSGSMGQSGRMQAVKNAATAFVNSLLKEDNLATRIALVSFGSDAWTLAGFQDARGKQTLLNAISGLSATGGTWTQAGLKLARDLLEDSTATQKVIVLLSDGEPTYSYRINNISNNLNSTYFMQSGTRWYTRYDLSESVFNYTGSAAGNGTSMTTRIQGSYYYHHGHSAIAEASFAKADGIAVYSVGLTPGASGQDILNRIADQGKSYSATTQNLEAIFKEVAGTIAYAATDAVVTDPIGEKFSMPSDASEITCSEGTRVEYDPDEETITWYIPFVSEANPATLSYIVEIDPDAVSGVVYPTNGDTPIEYTNALGNRVVKPFPVPRVGINAGTIVVHYYRVNADGQPVNSQGIPVSREGAELLRFTFMEGTQLELNQPYSVFFSGDDASETTRQINGIWYSYSSAGDPNPKVVTLTTSQPSQDVWFACLQEPPQIAVTNYKGYYDGQPHSIGVSGTVDGDQVWFRKDGGEWSLDNPGFVDAGTYTVNVKVTNPLYPDRTKTGTVEIMPTPVTVTADDKSKTYGDADPELTYRITSGKLIGDDQFTGELDRDDGESVGTYAITRGTLSLSANYDLTFVQGELTIQKRNASVTTDNKAKLYGEEDPEFTGTLTGFLDKDGVTASYSREPGENVGQYNITATLSPESVLGNYSITYGTGTFTIIARPLEITAGSASKTYNGEPLTANTYKITGGGLAEGDKLVSVQITGSQTSVGSSPNKASNAVIKRGEEDVTANYAITYVDGLLTVTSPSTPPPPPPPPEEEIPDDFPPLLNLEDHFAYIDGYPDNTVRPEGLITREEVAAVFFRLLDPDYREVIRAYVSNFSDVSPDRWSSKHIATLARGRILEGYPDGTFRPGNFITRAELATIAARFDELSFLEENVFPDVEGHWAEKYINSAAAKGWVEGYPDGTFKPDDYITRAEFVTLVNRVLQRRVRLEDILSEARQFPDLLPGKWYYEAMQEAINSHLYERKDDGFETWLEITYPEIEM